MRAEACLLLSLLFTACGGGKPAVGGPTPQGADAEAADRVTDLITEALRADARMDRADSLYDSGAIIVADGERRTSVPRYAGISSGGQVAVGSSQIDATRGFAWAYIEYRWLAPGQNLVREARLTAVLAPTGTGSFHILSAHSSTIRVQPE